MSKMLITVPIDHIKVRPQIRTQFDEGRIQGLAASIAESGLQQPVLCVKDGGGYWLLDGECRLRACLLLGWTEVPVLLAEEGLSDADALARQLVCNLQRTDLNPIEKARGIHELMQRGGLTGEQAAKRLGLSAADVSRSLALLKLPPTLLEQVAGGTIAADAAYQLSRVADPAEQATLAAEVAGRRLTRDALARKLRRVRHAGNAESRCMSRVTAMLGSGRSITFVGKGLTLDALIEWMEPLLSRAKKAKAQGITLQTFIRTLKDQATA